MPSVPKRTASLLIRLRTWRISPLELIKVALVILFLLQTGVVMVLWLVAVLRRHSKHESSFPRIPLPEVQVGANRLQLYSYGQELYTAMLAAIDRAQESIFLESFIWKDDAVGQEFKAHLVKKAEEGVAVYVIFDSFGNLVVPREFKMFPPTISVLEYQSIHRLWHLLDPRRYSLDHRKLLIVDGSVGFIGGYNLGSVYATQWRDTHLRICGPAAADLAQSFIDFWNHTLPPSREIRYHYKRTFDPLINVHGNNALRLTFPIRDMYITAIDRAECSILLTNAYFVPDRYLLAALKEAAKRGVDVRVLVPWNSNHIVVDWLARGYFRECLQAGVRVFGYRHTMLHAKTCTIDGQWSTIGTANLDRLSSIGNYEINVEVYSAELAQQMQELFECDTADMFAMTLSRWERRPWYWKVGERILAPLRILL